MKNNAYQYSKLKHQLMQKKRNGTKEIIWKLEEESKDYIENLGFETEPYLYTVYTRRFCNIKKLDPILRTIHYKNKEGKKSIVVKLSKRQQQLLDEYGIKYVPCKYRIKLCG